MSLGNLISLLEFPGHSDWIKEKRHLRSIDIEVVARFKDTTPFYQYTGKIHFITYNIVDYFINGLYSGMPAQTDDGFTGNVVWIGRRWDRPESVYAGVEMVSLESSPFVIDPKQFIQGNDRYHK